ncbi:DgyrCDS6988 [Dimorphilus gyrociliatus]|uniref:DgyrCDS6988 n=1 Tax=Dimorphilus gyrociliatus TaxID=2664684 RepID=A0A7I8VQA8_9ANNE|nr:DgyrCDS6988 [Dimorphilus gyrociliatus]
MGKLPDRWEDYMPCGQRINNTRFIAFKAPLKRSLTSQLPLEQQFNTSDLLERLHNENLTIGLVIDLTNTTRYYCPSEFKSEGIEYVKIFTEGHVVPSKDVTTKFFKCVYDFEKANEDNEKLIGVHCTHGLNRTGYLICRYMVDRMDFQPNDAILAFNTARGHDIERLNYLQSLETGKSSIAGIDLDKVATPKSDEVSTYSKGSRRGYRRKSQNNQYNSNNHRNNSQYNDYGASNYGASNFYAYSCGPENYEGYYYDDSGYENYSSSQGRRYNHRQNYYKNYDNRDNYYASNYSNQYRQGFANDYEATDSGYYYNSQQNYDLPRNHSSYSRYDNEDYKGAEQRNNRSKYEYDNVQDYEYCRQKYRSTQGDYDSRQGNYHSRSGHYSTNQEFGKSGNEYSDISERGDLDEFQNSRFERQHVHNSNNNRNQSYSKGRRPSRKHAPNAD